LGEGQGPEGCLDRQQETAQDVSVRNCSDSSSSKSALGEVAKATEEDGVIKQGAFRFLVRQL
jgi:hypothetical protein